MADELYLRDDFARAWQGQDPFACANALTGKIYREIANRKTLQFHLNDKNYFVKIHRGIGLREMIKSLLNGNTPVWGARQEWNAILALKKIGVKTMTPVAFAEKGILPWRQQSFLVTEELINTVSLEDLCKVWPHEKPSYGFKKALIEKVGAISRLLHTHGINHRDYYLCHFLLPISCVDSTVSNDISLYLIDLHRAQQRVNIPLRWVIKDIGSLYFSALDIGLTQRDLLRFIKNYTQLPLKKALSDQYFWQAVEARAHELYQK